jgi:hypothetical protein
MNYPLFLALMECLAALIASGAVVCYLLHCWS